jgi:hypothetical protein
MVSVLGSADQENKLAALVYIFEAFWVILIII